MSMTTNFGIEVTFYEELLPIKSHDPEIEWCSEIT